MRKRIKQNVNAEVIAFWRSRLSALGEKLAKNRHAADAWFWRVQSDILNYLLHRYGGDPRTPAPSPGPGAAIEPMAAKPVPLEFQPSGSFGSAGGVGKMPRASGAIRPMLENIARGNAERYVVFKRAEEEMEAALRTQSENLREWMKTMMQHGIEHGLLEVVEEAKIANEGMSEDEIVEMLSKIINMDEPPADGGGREETPPVNGSGD